MRHKQLLHFRSILQTEISNFPKLQNVGFLCQNLICRQFFTPFYLHREQILTPLFLISPPQGTTSYFYFNKSRKKLKHISQYFVRLPLGHCDMYLSTMKHLLISQPLWIHQILLGWLNTIHTLEDRLLGSVSRFPLYLLLSPTGAWQGFYQQDQSG